MEIFDAVIKKIEDKDATYVEIPFDVEKTYGSKRVKVKATFDGVEYRGSIVKMGLPCYMLGMTKEIRNQIGKQAGEMVKVTVEKDDEERVIEIPEDFKTKLDNNSQALEFWNTLSFSSQKKYSTWIISAKKEDTRSSRIISAIEKLQNKEKI